MRYKGLASQCILTIPPKMMHWPDPRCNKQTKNARNGICLDTWEGGRNLNFTASRGAFQYWCLNSEKWTLLFYLVVKLWTITPAIINSVGPSITESIHNWVHNWESFTWVEDWKTMAIKIEEKLSGVWMSYKLASSRRRLVDVYKTYLCWLSNLFRRNFWGFLNFHTHCLVPHWNWAGLLWNKTVEK